jgi:hypothetical protein
MEFLGLNRAQHRKFLFEPRIKKTSTLEEKAFDA